MIARYWGGPLHGQTATKENLPVELYVNHYEPPSPEVAMQAIERGELPPGPKLGIYRRVHVDPLAQAADYEFVDNPSEGNPT